MHASQRRRARRVASAVAPGLVVALLIGAILATQGEQVLAAVVACPALGDRRGRHGSPASPWRFGPRPGERCCAAPAGSEGSTSEPCTPRTPAPSSWGRCRATRRCRHGSRCFGASAVTDAPDRLPDRARGRPDLHVRGLHLRAARGRRVDRGRRDPALGAAGRCWRCAVAILARSGSPTIASATGAGRRAGGARRARTCATGWRHRGWPSPAWPCSAPGSCWSAFGLPSGPADVALVLFSMGAIGLLPIGVGTGPTATIAALGATNLAAATAAGMVVERRDCAGGRALRGGVLDVVGSPCAGPRSPSWPRSCLCRSAASPRPSWISPPTLHTPLDAPSQRSMASMLR